MMHLEEENPGAGVEGAELVGGSAGLVGGDAEDGGLTQSAESRKAFAAIWDTLHLTDETLQLAFDATIVPTACGAFGAKHLAQLPLLLHQSAELRPAELCLKSTLGQGGMGMVQEALQVSLGRDVAVKRVRPDQRTEETTQRLLQEAWCTGLLEHPNIVPVYSLGVDDKGEPMMVMKKIEGIVWRHILNAKAQVPAFHREAHERDPLGWNLEVWMQVCAAVHFAHSKGIVHRDLKPENIMIGPFGEVYLLDWGIAVSTNEAHAGRLPLARELQGLAGTPAYMPPEMAAGEGARIDRRTDIYLLGAILHELLTGSPPHVGDSLFQVLHRAFRSVPHVYKPEVPQELAAICHRAMAAQPDERFGDAATLRQAVAAFLQHRRSQLLSDEAAASLKKLKSWCVQEEEACSFRDPVETYRLFGECRFGFQLALREWPKNQQAREGFVATLACMASWEIAQGHVEAAAALLAEIEEPDPHLLTRLETLRAQKDAEAQELQDIRHDLDVEVSSTLRSYLTVLLALIWGAFPLAEYFLTPHHGGAWRTQDYAPAGLLFILEVLVGAYFWRRSLLQNRVNRQLVFSALLIGFSTFVFWNLAGHLGLSNSQGMSIYNGLFFLIATMVAITIDARLFYASAVYLTVILLSLAFPSTLFWLSAAGHILSFSLMSFVWNPFDRHSPA